MQQNLITDFNNRLELLRQDVSADNIFAVIAEEKLIALLEEMQKAKNIFLTQQINDKEIKALNSLINQANDFLDFVQDSIEARRINL